MQKSTIAWLVLCIALALSGAWAVHYGTMTILANRDGAAVARADRLAWDRRNKQVSSLGKTFDRVQDVHRSLAGLTFITSDDNQIQLQSDMERIGRTFGAKVSVDDLQVSTDNASVSGSLVVVGDWKDVYQVLRGIEAYPYRIDIVDLSVQDDPTAPAGSGAHANLRFIIRNAAKPDQQ